MPSTTTQVLLALIAALVFLLFLCFQANDDHRAALLDARTQLKSTTTQARALAGNIGGYNLTIKDMEAREKRLKEKIKAMHSAEHVHDLESQLAHIGQQLRNERAAVRPATRPLPNPAVLEQTIRNLRAALEGKKEALLPHMRAQLDAANEAVHVSNAALSDANRKISRQDAFIARGDAEVERLEAALHVAETALQQANAALQATSEQANAALQATFEQANPALQVAKADSELKDVTMAGQEQRIRCLEMDVSIRDNEIKNLRSQLLGEDIDALFASASNPGALPALLPAAADPAVFPAATEPVDPPAVPPAVSMTAEEMNAVLAAAVDPATTFLPDFDSWIDGDWDEPSNAPLAGSSTAPPIASAAPSAAAPLTADASADPLNTLLACYNLPSISASAPDSAPTFTTTTTTTSPSTSSKSGKRAKKAKKTPATTTTTAPRITLRLSAPKPAPSTPAPSQPAPAQATPPQPTPSTPASPPPPPADPPLRYKRGDPYPDGPDATLEDKLEWNRAHVFSCGLPAFPRLNQTGPIGAEMFCRLGPLDKIIIKTLRVRKVCEGVS